MKLISRLVLPLMFSNFAFATTIYGMEHINEYRYRFKKPVYVQMGSFKIQANAINYKKSLQRNTRYKVFIKYVNDRYKVQVGPFHDADSLKILARNFGAKPSSSAMVVTQKSEAKKYEYLNVSSKTLKPIATQDKSSSPSLYMNVNFGASRSKAPSSTSVNNGLGFPFPFDQDIYTADASRTQPLIGVQVGRRWELTNAWISAVSLGLQYQYFFSSKIRGQVIELTLPQFTNYNYQWKMATSLLLANAKLNFLAYQQFSPYFNVGIGTAFNHSSYQESAVVGVTPRISPEYERYSSGQLAYILGAGLDFSLCSDLILSAGYQFSYLGKQRSGNGLASWSSQHLNFGKNQSNAIILGMTYLIDKKTEFKYKK